MTGTGQPRILIVDDEPDILESIKDLLEAMMPEVDVETVESGADALAALAADAYDLVISDYKMPEMDGLELLRRIRDQAPGVPRVLMTAFPDLSIAIDAINEASVENFFVKPLEPEEIVQQLRAMLDARIKESQRKQAFARAMGARGGQEVAHE